MDALQMSGSTLTEISPTVAGPEVETLISKDSKRLEALKDMVEKKAERLNESKQKSNEVYNVKLGLLVM